MTSPTRGDVLSYSYEGYSTMMFVDETDKEGFWYWSLRILSGTNAATVNPYRQYMCDMMKNGFDWEPFSKTMAGMVLVVMADELIAELVELEKQMNTMAVSRATPESYHEAIALGLEVNLHTEKHYALERMGALIYGEENVSADSSHRIP